MSSFRTETPLVQVVEDDRDIREALCDLIEAWGYRTVAAPNGYEALEYLAQGEKPAVIVLDLMMPVMDGLRFREEQLKNPELVAIPVVAITAGGVPNGVLDLEVLRKPFTIEALLARIRRYC